MFSIFSFELKFTFFFQVSVILSHLKYFQGIIPWKSDNRFRKVSRTISNENKNISYKIHNSI